ncbi:nitroreductase family protein [Desulfovibrio ferrophilus]|nr:nitroreductase family protein [Desulfovibrio ferrophilus]
MNFTELAFNNRTFRRFDPSVPIGMETLEDLLETARYTASAMNKQPLRHVLVTEPGKCAEVFAGLAWAGYLKDWPGPEEGQRPTGYVVICHEGEPGPWSKVDLGIVAQTIMLGAVEKGFGGCMLGALKKDVIGKALNLPEELEIMLVLALGRPAETVVVEDLEPGEDFKYWREDDDTHHVPKRTKDELIVAKYPAADE